MIFCTSKAGFRFLICCVAIWTAFWFEPTQMTATSNHHTSLEVHVHKLGRVIWGEGRQQGRNSGQSSDRSILFLHALVRHNGDTSTREDQDHMTQRSHLPRPLQPRIGSQLGRSHNGTQGHGHVWEPEERSKEWLKNPREIWRPSHVSSATAGIPCHASVEDGTYGRARYVPKQETHEGHPSAKLLRRSLKLACTLGGG